MSKLVNIIQGKYKYHPKPQYITLFVFGLDQQPVALIAAGL